MNHLSSAFALAPQKASNLMVELLAYNRGNTLNTYISKLPVRTFQDDGEYYWDIITSARKNIPLVEARDENGTQITTASTGMVGAGTAPFYLVFAEDYFAKGEVIFGNLNQVYPIRILDDARLEGSNVVYRVELMGGNQAGIPVDRLQAGERFSVGFAPVERELSRKVGSKPLIINYLCFLT